MFERTRKVAWHVWDNTPLMLGVGVVVWMLCLMLGCAGSSSTISPARSDASDRSLRVTAPVERTWELHIAPRGVGYEAVDEGGEDK